MYAAIHCPGRLDASGFGSAYFSSTRGAGVDQERGAIGKLEERGVPSARGDLMDVEGAWNPGG